MFVGSVSGKTLTLGVRGGDSVEQLKSVVREREGIPADHQRVLAGGETTQRWEEFEGVWYWYIEGALSTSI